MTDKTTFFDNATRRILDGTDAINPDIHEFVTQLRTGFTLPAVRMAMVPYMHSLNCYPAQGFCEPASLALIDKLGPEWNLMEINWRDWSGGPHFFIQNRITGQQMDITYDQYAVRGVSIPYSRARVVKIDRRRSRLLRQYLAQMGISHE